MINAPMAAMRGLVVGAGLGLVVGVAIDFLHLNAPALVFWRVALTPSIWVPLLGAVLGLVIAVMVEVPSRSTRG
jgi:hypothetical protein